MCEKAIGWEVSLWIDASQVQASDRSMLPYLSWSPYDRITIDEVQEFSQFFQVKSSQDWNGAIQRLHLIPMGECPWQLQKDRLISNGDSKQEPYGLYCIVTARYKYRFENVNEVEKGVRQSISECLRDKGIQWHGFRSLGAEDFVGIFLANNITDLAEAVALVKQITYTDGSEKKVLFDSVYSFMGLNIPNFCQEPKADLLVRLHLKAGRTRQEVHDQLERNFRMIFGDHTSKIAIRDVTSGKGCIEITIPNHNKAFSCFHNNQNAMFNGRSDFYTKYIESSRTYWYISEENNLIEDKDIGAACVCEEQDIQKEDFEGYTVHPVSQFILKEYERMINSQRCLWWRSILQRQYKLYATFVKEYTDDENQIALCKLNNKVQTVLLHINQATAPIYEIPYHNYFYSGSYNDILRMYYGIIAAIFNLAYRLPRDESTDQHEIVYCVDFEEAAKVHSSMYTLQKDSKRFVIFHLPYDAFMKFDKTIKLLLHEVFHYVAPYDRSMRNFTFIKVWIIDIFFEYVFYLHENGLSQQNERHIVDYFMQEYVNICQTMEAKLGHKLDLFISNDFTTPNKLMKMRPVMESIFEVICNKFEDEAGVWLKEVKHYCDYSTVYKKLLGKNRPSHDMISTYSMEYIRRVSLAAKEAFCDINMMNILSLSLGEYLMLLYDSLFGDYKSVRVSESVEEAIRKGSLNIGSFELRVGMVVDNYYLNKLQNDEPVKYRDQFVEDIREMNKKTSDKYKIFFQYLSRAYDKYLRKFGLDRERFTELFTGERRWIDSFEQNIEQIDRLRKAASIQEGISDNISVINDFINVEIDQRMLNKNKLISRAMKHSGINSTWMPERTVVQNLGEYVEQCCRIVQEWNDDIVWYRGVCNESFSLLPSLFRNLDSNKSLYANQAGFLQDAYYATISDAQLWTEQLKTVLEHMGLLQHYGIPTSLLDFSEDMLMALHFALNPDVPKDLENVDRYVYQPKVVLFNPSKYKNAIISMQKGRMNTLPADISPILLDIQEDLVKDYCVHDRSREFISEHSARYTQDYTPNPRDMKYPEPIAIRRSNARIQMQKGTFLAYNLSAMPERSGKQESEYYSYLDLIKIQEAYMEMFGDEMSQKEGKFIKEIYISKQDIPTIKRQLKTMNVTTARAYPELFRVFAESMERYRAKQKK